MVSLERESLFTLSTVIPFPLCSLAPVGFLGRVGTLYIIIGSSLSLMLIGSGSVLAFCVSLWSFDSFFGRVGTVYNINSSNLSLMFIGSRSVLALKFPVVFLWFLWRVGHCEHCQQ